MCFSKTAWNDLIATHLDSIWVCIHEILYWTDLPLLKKLVLNFFEVLSDRVRVLRTKGFLQCQYHRHQKDVHFLLHTQSKFFDRFPPSIFLNKTYLTELREKRFHNTITAFTIDLKKTFLTWIYPVTSWKFCSYFNVTILKNNFWNKSTRNNWVLNNIFFIKTTKIWTPGTPKNIF